MLNSNHWLELTDGYYYIKIKINLVIYYSCMTYGDASLAIDLRTYLIVGARTLLPGFNLQTKHAKRRPTSTTISSSHAFLLGALPYVCRRTISEKPCKEPKSELVTEISSHRFLMLCSSSVDDGC